MPEFDASVAAHLMARHQPTPADTLHWNALALRHADALTDDRARELLPSLCETVIRNAVGVAVIDAGRVGVHNGPLNGVRELCHQRAHPQARWAY